MMSPAHICHAHKAHAAHAAVCAGARIIGILEGVESDHSKALAKAMATEESAASLYEAKKEEQVKEAKVVKEPRVSGNLIPRPMSHA